jgi:hypothetical protein
MDNIYCSGDERQLADCRFDGWGTSDCEASEAAGVVCSTAEEETTTEPTTTTTRGPRLPIEVNVHTQTNSMLHCIFCLDFKMPGVL